MGGCLSDAPDRARATRSRCEVPRRRRRSDWPRSCARTSARSSCSWLADDRRADAGRFELYYLFAHPREDWFVHAVKRLPGDHPTINSLGTFHHPASLFEREIHDLFGIASLDHPDPRPLVRHGFWPEDYFPLRKDARPARLPRRRPAVSLHGGRRRGRVRDPGGTGARRRDRAGTFPLQRGGRDDHRHEGPALLHAQGHREALRGPDARRGGRAGRARLRRHERRPRARVLSGARVRGRDGGARRALAICASSCWSWSGSTTTSPISA